MLWTSPTAGSVTIGLSRNLLISVPVGAMFLLLYYAFLDILYLVLFGIHVDCTPGLRLEPPRAAAAAVGEACEGRLYRRGPSLELSESKAPDSKSGLSQCEVFIEIGCSVISVFTPARHIRRAW